MHVVLHTSYSSLRNNICPSSVCPGRLLMLFFTCAVKLAKFRLVESADCTLNPKSANCPLMNRRAEMREREYCEINQPPLCICSYCNTTRPPVPRQYDLQSCSNICTLFLCSQVCVVYIYIYIIFFLPVS